jgi:ribosomal protein S18 acetylase RimI-like enzyme
VTVPDAPPGYVIEAADTDAADAMADLWVELAADQRRHGSHLLAAENRDRIHETMLQHVVTDTTLVARRTDGGAVVGFVTFGLESESYTQEVARGVVHNVYVREGDRDEGVGSALLAAAEATLGEYGVDAVGLEAMADNDAARRFYRRHGYTPHRVELEKSLESDSLTTDDG